jgi:hypothetical protein
MRVFENWMLRKISGDKTDEVTEDCTRLHSERFVYALPNIIRVIKSRRVSWAEHVARAEEKRVGCRILVRKSEGKRPFEDLDVDRRIILIWSFKKYDRAWTGLVWFITVFTTARHLSPILSHINPVYIPSCLLKIHFNIIQASMPRSPKWSLSFGFPHQSPVYTSPLPVLATCPAHLILLVLITRRTFGEEYRS